MSLAKPQLRGLLASQIKRNLFFAIGFSAICTSSWYFFVLAPRRKRYADFYRNYNPDAEFEEMKKTGRFTSVSSDD